MSVEPNQSPPLDDKKKNALMRYIFVLFAVAFLLILLTFFMQLRDSNQTISELVQSNASALQNAEKLQEENRLLLERVADLELEMVEQEDDSQDAVLDLTLQLETAEDIKTALIADSAAMEEMLKDTLWGYEALLQGEAALNEGNIEAAKAELPVIASYLHLLGNQGQTSYEALVAAIELAENPPIIPEETLEEN